MAMPLLLVVISVNIGQSSWSGEEKYFLKEHLKYILTYKVHGLYKDEILRFTHDGEDGDIFECEAQLNYELKTGQSKTPNKGTGF